MEASLVGTANYIAPELLRNFASSYEHCIYSLKTDAFGIGMTLINLFFPSIFDSIFYSKTAMPLT